MVRPPHQWIYCFRCNPSVGQTLKSTSGFSEVTARVSGVDTGSSGPPRATAEALAEALALVHPRRQGHVLLSSRKRYCCTDYINAPLGFGASRPRRDQGHNGRAQRQGQGATHAELRLNCRDRGGRAVGPGRGRAMTRSSKWVRRGEEGVTACD